MSKQTLFATTIRVLPWTLALLGATLLVLGVMWHHITDADTANGPLVGAGIAVAALALATSCCVAMPPKQTDESNKPTAQLPLVPVAA